MTKTEALHALRLYMHDARAEARQEGFKIDRTEVWSQMVAGWREIGDISNETAAAWIASGPR